MPPPSKTENREFTDLALPYVTNDSPIGSDANYVAGLNILASVNRQIERRPGFSAYLETVPTDFVNVRRIHVWQRWDDPSSGSTRAAFIAMINDISNGTSLVYKYQIGTDQSAILIHADTKSQNPFFFVDSNNQCYFGNGTSGNMKRYNGTDLFNWGIQAPASAPVISLPSGTVPSTANPGSGGQVIGVTVTSAGTFSSQFATASISGGGGTGATAVVNMTVVSYSGGPIFGVQSVIVTHPGSGYSSAPSVNISGSGSGAGAVAHINSSGTSTGGAVAPLTQADAVDSYTVSQGSSLPALTYYQHIQYMSTAPHGFSIGQFVSIEGNAVDGFNRSGFIVPEGFTNSIFELDYFAAAPVTTGLGGNAALSTSDVMAGITVTTSKSYLVTYGYGTGTGSGATSVGESSPSPISNVVGPFSNNVPLIPLIPSTDPQVNQIHVYATTDGGAQDPEQMREIAGSPFPNLVATEIDTTIDEDLGETAPAFNRNDPPTPSSAGVWYAQRIWTKSSNTLYYSGFEEIGRGVPEECFPSGLDGNNRPYSKDIRGIGVLPDGIAVMNSSKINKVEGDSLDSFRFYGLLDKRGTKSEANISSIGGSVSWLDISGTVWNSDLGEISIDIRPDTQSINQNYSAITTHVSGNFHWIVVMDGQSGKLLVFDLDKKQWMVPWQVGTSIGCIGSFETADGVTDLLISRNGKHIMKLVPNTYNDEGNTYPAFVTTSQFNIAPDKSPQWKGVIDWIEWKRNTTSLLKIEQLTDDDPLTGTYVDLTSTIQPSPSITQGKFMLTERASSNSPTAQLATLKFTWPTEEKNFKLYSISLASHPVGA